MKQAIKKGSTIKKPTISEIKEKLGLASKKDDLTMSNADKPLSFIPMPKAFVDAVRLPGFPQGYMSIITGWSNTGKSTLINCLIASCVDNGILPVIYDTENNFDFKYAIDCGLKATPVYGEVKKEYIDEETGEVTTVIETEIIEWEGDFIYFNSRKLAEAYGNMDYSQGKETSKNRGQACIEDVAYSINKLLNAQKDGDIMQDMCFIWDSVGSLDCFKGIASNVNNNMWNAGALSVAFNNLLNGRIPSSRSVASEYTNTFVCVNKIWNDSMNAVGPAASIELKGGRSFYYSARLILHVGGVAKAGIKKLTATAKGETYNYGIMSKISVTKNQLPSPFNISYANDIACVHNGLCSPDELDKYKKEYIPEMLKRLQELSNGKEVEASDLTFGEKESED